MERWKAEREKILIDNFPTCDWDELAELCNTTVKAVQVKASRLKLKKDGLRSIHKWTDEEDNTLRNNFMNMEIEQLAVFIGINFTRVKNRCYRLGLRKRFIKTKRIERSKSNCSNRDVTSLIDYYANMQF
jgi:hypothetical protein